MARTSASRWPSDRSPGCRSPGTSGRIRSRRRRHDPRVDGGLGVSGGTLLVHRVGEEQVRRVVGHQGDQASCLRRRGSGRVNAVDRHRAGGPTPRALDRPEQRGLARPVASHQGDDLSLADLEVDRPHRRGRPVGDHEALRGNHGRPRAGRADRCGDAVEAVAQVAGVASGLADAQRHRVPAGEPTEHHYRRCDRRGGEDRFCRVRRSPPRSRRARSPGRRTARRVPGGALP